MSKYITKEDLEYANYDNVIRLAKYLHLNCIQDIPKKQLILIVLMLISNKYLVSDLPIVKSSD